MSATETKHDTDLVEIVVAALDGGSPDAFRGGRRRAPKPRTRPGRIRVTTERVSEPGSEWSNALGAAVHQGNWLLVRVRDTGAGMDAATQRRIFEPFFSTKVRGHGLGLGSCLGIVKAHGGAIDRARGLR
jgi:signal transduction histidine kinase